eukprot:scaffold183433_cov43-Prasinocladus_malaysianus.AAC.1
MHASLATYVILRASVICKRKHWQRSGAMIARKPGSTRCNTSFSCALVMPRTVGKEGANSTFRA